MIKVTYCISIKLINESHNMLFFSYIYDKIWLFLIQEQKLFILDDQTCYKVTDLYFKHRILQSFCLDSVVFTPIFQTSERKLDELLCSVMQRGSVTSIATISPQEYWIHVRSSFMIDTGLCKYLVRGCSSSHCYWKCM